MSSRWSREFEIGVLGFVNWMMHTLYLSLGRSYEAGTCTIEISVTRAFRCYSFHMVYTYNKIMKIAWPISYVAIIDLGNFVISTFGSKQNKTIYHLKALLTLITMVQVTASYLQL